MGLQDVARTISHYKSTQGALILTIRAIGSGRPSLAELKERTGLKERYLRYMITLLRHWGIVRGERDREVYRYRLTPDAFSVHMRLSLIKAIENAASNRDEE